MSTGTVPAALTGTYTIDPTHSRIGFVGDHPTNAYGFTSSEDRRR